jgi:hypothetical protein
MGDAAIRLMDLNGCGRGPQDRRRFRDFPSALHSPLREIRAILRWRRRRSLPTYLVRWLKRLGRGYGSATAIIDPPTLSPCVDVEDPDDYRPDSSWAAAVDPLSSDGVYVSDACVMIDEVAPGDIVPLHTHTTYEVIYVDHSSVEVQLGAELRIAEPGAILFDPPGVPHRARALTEAVRLIGFFPTTVVEITYQERNPAPGTEGDPPQPSVTFDVRSTLKG